MGRLRSGIFRDYLPASHNRIEVTMQTLLSIGNAVGLTARTEGIDAPLHAQVTIRAATELDLAPGSRVTVMLRKKRYIF